MKTTKDEQKEQAVVENFLSSLDTEMPISEHFKNCMRDACLYKWSSALVVKIMTGIEDAYRRKKGE